MGEWKLAETPYKIPLSFMLLSLSLSLSRMRAMVRGGEPVDLYFFDKWAWVDVFCSDGLREDE